jgi:hypothetical protein
MSNSTPVSGVSFNRGVAPSSVTGGKLLLAADEIVKAAMEGLLSAAEDIVKPTAVEKAPLLVDVAKAGSGHGPHADPAKYQGGKVGELRASAHVIDERDSESRVGVGFDTPYASLQHERMDWHHAVGEAKFLENALNETHDEVIARIADKIREVTR